MAKWKRIALVAIVWMILPQLSQAQGVANEIKGLHGVLEGLYDEMMPLCEKLTGVAKGIAGFAALFYIATRVWRHIANAEPIDFYPLFRPFVLGFTILNFSAALGLINLILKPTVTATAEMVEGSDKAIETLVQKREEALKNTDTWQMYVGESQGGDRDKWYKYTHDNQSPKSEGFFASIGNDIKFAMSKAAYNFKQAIKEAISEVLKLLFEAAALCIDTLRTFQLVVLSILGPLVLGFAVFDGLQNSFISWLSRYINVYMWLPVANIFGAIIGKIQESMINLDIQQIDSSGDSFFSTTDAGYLIFMVIGIVGYFTVPTVAGFIVTAGGGNNFLQKVTSMASGSFVSGYDKVSGMGSKSSGK